MAKKRRGARDSSTETSNHNDSDPGLGYQDQNMGAALHLSEGWGAATGRMAVAMAVLAVATNMCVPVGLLSMAVIDTHYSNAHNRSNADTPLHYIHYIPDVFPALPNITFEHVVPPYPATMSQAWEIGRISEAVTHCPSGEATSCVSVLLAEATTLLSAKAPLTLQQLADAKVHMVNAEHQRGLLARMAGVFSLINIMWLVGAIGLLLTVVPCMFVLLDWIGLISVFKAIIIFVWKFIVSMVKRSHHFTSPLWCPLGYFLILSGTVHALKYGAVDIPMTDNRRFSSYNATIASYMGVLAAFLHLALTFINLVKLPKQGGPVANTLMAGTAVVYTKMPQKWRSALGAASGLPYDLWASATHFSATVAMHTSFAYCMVLFGSVAVVFQSQLAGFLCCAILFAWLGFFVAPLGLCYIIGFQNEASMGRAASAGLLLSSLFFMVRSFYGSDYCRQPAAGNLCFPVSNAAHILGSTVYFLALLISSSRMYHYNYNNNDASAYWRMQGLFVASIFVAVAAGLVMSVPSLYATAAVFSALYLLDKLVELSMWKRHDCLIVGMAVGFFALWKLASYCAAHPDVVSLWMSVLFAMFDERKWEAVRAAVVSVLATHAN